MTKKDLIERVVSAAEKFVDLSLWKPRSRRVFFWTLPVSGPLWIIGVLLLAGFFAAALGIGVVTLYLKDWLKGEGQ